MPDLKTRGARLFEEVSLQADCNSWSSPRDLCFSTLKIGKSYSETDLSHFCCR